VLGWLLDQLVRERMADQPGAGIASAQLAQLMFVQILRAHLEASEPLAMPSTAPSATPSSSSPAWRRKAIGVR
jgi:hypothetical protein